MNKNNDKKKKFIKEKQSGSSTFLQDKIPLVVFVFAVSFVSMGYGIFATKYNKFPYPTIMEAYKGVLWMLPNSVSLGWLYRPTKMSEPILEWDSARTQKGLNKVAYFGKDYSMGVKVMDMDGNTVHKWSLDWFDLWPDPKHLNDSEMPKSRPGTNVHGAEIMPNGDLVFNFSYHGLVRVNPCGDVVWRLPYRTHHSVFIDDKGDIWVSGKIKHEKPLEQFPFLVPPFDEETIVKVSADGEILLEKSIIDLLVQNAQQGLLYLTTVKDFNPKVTGDLLHLNDVEVFTESMSSGFFEAGDVMVSLRNANTILVFDQKDWSIKYRWSDEFVRQHDPDFVDGNTISVFDNNYVRAPSDNGYSRLVMKSVEDDKASVIFEGSKDHLFSWVMGKHQWLENGNFLYTAATNGRAVEITPEGDKVWDYINITEPGKVGVMTEVERLPQHYDTEFFERVKQACSS